MCQSCKKNWVWEYGFFIRGRKPVCFTSKVNYLFYFLEKGWNIFQGNIIWIVNDVGGIMWKFPIYKKELKNIAP
jgi:hypothetical protein